MRSKIAQNLQSPKKRVSRLNFLSRREVAEIPKLLMPGEQVMGVVSGFYLNGPATLAVTSKRLLLVDKKLLRLSFEDIRYDAIKEVSYSRQSLVASVRFFYAGRTLQFRSWYHRELRAIAQFAQHKIFEVNDEPDKTGLFTQDGSLDVQATNAHSETTLPYQHNEALEKYLNERIARWRRASRFIDELNVARTDTQAAE